MFHFRAPTAMEFIEKMKSIHATVAAHDFGNSNGTMKAFAWSRNYGTYVVTDLIALQMMRNLLLATVRVTQPALINQRFDISLCFTLTP